MRRCSIAGQAVAVVAGGEAAEGSRPGSAAAGQQGEHPEGAQPGWLQNRQRKVPLSAHENPTVLCNNAFHMSFWHSVQQGTQVHTFRHLALQGAGIMSDIVPAVLLTLLHTSMCCAS